jgi:hypothetical protein
VAAVATSLSCWSADFSVTSESDDGSGSANTLSWAISAVNRTSEESTITVGGNITTLILTGALPGLSHPVTVRTNATALSILGTANGVGPLLDLTSTFALDARVKLQASAGSAGGPGVFLGGGGQVGEPGSVALGGSGFMLTSEGTVTGGTGGTGGPGQGGPLFGGPGGGGGLGAVGGSAISATNFTLWNQPGSAIVGGRGGNGGNAGSGSSGFNTGGDGGRGGRGGNGGTAVNGSGFTVLNQRGATVAGGDAGNGSAGGVAGSGLNVNGIDGAGGDGGTGGDGIRGSGFRLTNAGEIRGGRGGTGGSGKTAGNPGTGGTGIVSTGDSIILNAGTIAAGTGPGAPGNAVQLYGGTNRLIIAPASSIVGAVLSSSAPGSDTLVLGVHPDTPGLGSEFSLAQLGVQFKGFTRFSKEGANNWQLHGTGGAPGDAWTVSDGTLSLASNAALVGDVDVSPSASMAGMAGARITGRVVSRGAFVLASSPSPAGAFTIVGDFLNGGSLRPTVAAATDFGRLRVTGRATLGGSLDVEVLGTSVLTGGTTLSGVLRAAEVTGTFASVQDNSALFDFAPVYTPTDVSLLVVPAYSALDSVNRSANPAARGAAHVFDTLLAGGTRLDPDMDRVVAALGALSSIDAVSGAVTQALPLLGGAHALLLMDTQRAIGQSVQSRQEIVTRRAAPHDLVTHKHLWLQTFGSWTDQHDRNGISGHSATTRGLVFGADTQIGAGYRMGIAIAYARSDIDSNSSAATQRERARSHHVMLYGSRRVAEDLNVDFVASMGRHTARGTRELPFVDRIAYSDHDGWNANLLGRVGRTFALRERTLFTTSLWADYSIVADERYSETGAGALDLAVAPDRVRRMFVGVDGRISREFHEGLTLTADLGAAYRVHGETSGMSATFAGASHLLFATPGALPGPWMARTALSLIHRPKDKLEFIVRYGIDLRHGLTNQTASVRLRWIF